MIKRHHPIFMKIKTQHQNHGCRYGCEHLFYCREIFGVVINSQEKCANCKTHVK